MEGNVAENEDIPLEENPDAGIIPRALHDLFDVFFYYSSAKTKQTNKQTNKTAH